MRNAPAVSSGPRAWRMIPRRIARPTVWIVAACGIATALWIGCELAVRTLQTAPRAAAPCFQIDLDHADADTLALLPGIGPVLAQRIVEDRMRSGALGGLVGLQRVRGIGPAIAAEIEPFVLVRCAEN